MLTQLRLPTVARLWPTISESADREGWPAARTLAALLEHEIAERAQRRIARHLLEARLPPGKTLDGFDFAAVSSLSKDCWQEKPAVELGASAAVNVPSPVNRAGRGGLYMWYRAPGAVLSPVERRAVASERGAGGSRSAVVWWRPGAAVGDTLFPIRMFGVARSQ